MRRVHPELKNITMKWLQHHRKTKPRYAKICDNCNKCTDDLVTKYVKVLSTEETKKVHSTSRGITFTYSFTPNEIAYIDNAIRQNSRIMSFSRIVYPEERHEVDELTKLYLRAFGGKADGL